MCLITGAFSEAEGAIGVAGELAGARPAAGYIGHLLLTRNPAPRCTGPSAPVIEHLCLPSRRQQAGRLVPESALKAGLSSDMLKSVNSKIAQNRRKASS